ncbi:S-adenosyl-L-methionine-dependent methyltransferase [Pleurostoma richardsiae]|uniref:S-adenosyl-L-methionine-dependent methyltransferase n=1 Tax=Pleurostoma richardsiae TaxID=41990 RepID=A0AA38RNQ7_9PEZI|nr:S-adenosyl-L-methionine-dependent methyltransferase [Pleurostoma richardsiae]
MAQQNQPSSYKHGHSDHTISTHLLRTAETEAAFLLPHIKKTDHILDVGCGPGTITIGLAQRASEGRTVGIDISAGVLQKAKTVAAEADVPTEGPGSVVFEEGNILGRLAYPDNTFDVVYAAHVFGHFPPPDLPLQALAEIRRVLKPGGVLATRDAAAQHFFPRSIGLDRLWVGNFTRVVHNGDPDADLTGTIMPAMFLRAGFDADRIRVGAAAQMRSAPEDRRWLAARAAGQLGEGDPFRQNWLDAGITEDEIRQTVLAAEKWAETEGAWSAALHCEMLAWK